MIHIDMGIGWLCSTRTYKEEQHVPKAMVQQSIPKEVFTNECIGWRCVRSYDLANCLKNGFGS